MRPIHAVLLAVVLALGLLGLSLFLGHDGTGHDGSSDPSATSDPAASTNASASAALSTPGDDTHVDERARAARTARADERAAAEGVVALGLTGRVIDGRGRPVGGAVVYADGGGPDAFPLDFAEDEGFGWLARVDGKTDADGRFTLKPKAKHQARLAVRAANFAPYDSTFPIAGAAHDLGDVVLEDGVVLTGRVADSSGRGVAGARLYRVPESTGGFVFVGARGGGALVAKSDAQGRFRVDQLRAGPWSVRIESDDHPDQIETGETDRPGANLANLEFVLADGDEITGRVQGAPADVIAKLWVRAFARSSNEDSGVDVIAPGEFFGAARSARVAADGTFRLRGLKKGRAYKLVARDSEREYFGKTRSSSVQANAGERDVVLPYKPETAIVCQVVDGVSGAPVEQLDVSGGFGFAMPLEDLEGRPQRRFPGGNVRFALPGSRSRADQGAEFRIRAKGFHDFTRENLAVVDGQDLDLGIVRLERSPVVRVTVRDASSREPVDKASVSLEEVQPAGGAEGGRVMRTLNFDVSSEGQEFEYGGSTRARTDATGVAQLNSKPGKRVTVRVSHATHAPWVSGAIDLPSDGDHELDVLLGQGGTVVVNVIDTHEKPVSGAEVEHQAPGQDTNLLQFGGSDDRSDARGIVEFEHLMPGVHRFRIGSAGNGGAFIAGGGVLRVRGRNGEDEEAKGWTDVTVAEGSTETIKLVAPERASLVGRVRESGRALAGANVSLEKKTDGDEPRFSFPGSGIADQTDGKGDFEHASIDAGSYRVTVTHPTRFMDWEGEVEVRAGENRFDIELPLAIVEGRVTGADGKPIAGVRVHAERAPGDDDGKPRVQRSFMAVIATDTGDEPEFTVGGPGTGRTVTTDSDGKYKLRGVLPGVDLLVKGEAKDAQPGHSAKFRVAPDETRSNVDLQLERGGTCDVTLVRRDGKPAGACMVRATFEGDGGVDPRTEFSGMKGNVKLGGLKPGRWRVNVDPVGAFAGGDQRPQIPEQVVEVRAGETANARFEVP